MANKRVIALVSSLTFALGSCVITTTPKKDFKCELKKVNKQNSFKVKSNKEKFEELNKLKKEYEQKRLEEENLKKQKEEELLRQQRQKEQQKYKEYILTFYTSLVSENSKYGGVTCQRKKLRYGMVANNDLPLGTKIHIKGFGDFEVSDRGGSDFNDWDRLDVFIPRNEDESDYQYLRRVNNMGRVYAKGYIKK